MSDVSPMTRLWEHISPTVPVRWTDRTKTFFYQWLLLSIGFSLTYFISESTGLLNGPRGNMQVFFAGFSLCILFFIWLMSFCIGLFLKTFPKMVSGSEWLGNSKIQKSDALVDFIAQRDQIPTKHHTLFDKATVMREIDDRVERLRNRTSMFLAAIALALVAAAIVVMFAGRLTSLDAEAVSNVDRGKTELSEAVRSLSRLLKFQSLFQELATANNAQGAAAGAAPALDKRIGEIRKDIESLSSSYSRDAISTSNSGTPVDVDSAHSMVEAQQKEVTNLTTLVDDIRKKELLADRGYGDWRYIVATAITRVGVVLIIVFLVQILMGLYRYNTKLMAYYNSRRDLLTLWDGKPASLVALNKILTLPQIDFGKEPKHPLEDIIRSIGETGAATGRHTERSNTKKVDPT